MLEPKKAEYDCAQGEDQDGCSHVQGFGMAVVGGGCLIGFCDEEYHAECVIGGEEGREKCTGHVDVKAIVTELGKKFPLCSRIPPVGERPIGQRHR